MTEEQQCKALWLLKRASVFVPRRRLDRPSARKSLGDEIDDFLHEVAAKEGAEQ